MAKNPSILCLILLLALFAIQNCYASGPVTVQKFSASPKNWSFVENRGQLADQEGNLLEDIKYYSHSGGANIYCRPGMISFVFTKIENEPDQISEATGTSVGFPLLKATIPVYTQNL